MENRGSLQALAKGIRYQHKQLSASLLACASYFNLSITTRICNVVPYIWDGGNLDLYGRLVSGGTVCFCHTPTPEGVSETIISKNCTWLLLPPTLLTTVHLSAFTHLDTILSGGEAPTSGQFENWKQNLPNTKLYNAYGLTETGIVNVAWKCPSVNPENLTSIPIGKPFGKNNTIIDEETGELILSSPQIPQGYLRNIDTGVFLAPPNRYSDSYYAMRTGDAAWEDADGLIHIRGRLDGRLSIFSLHIEPAEPEDVACSVGRVNFAHLFVHELGEGVVPALVLAYHDSDERDENGVLLKQQYEAYAADLEKKLRKIMLKHVPEYQRPSAYLPLGHIPRQLSSNKKDGKRIAEIARDAQERGLVEFTPFSLNL